MLTGKTVTIVLTGKWTKDLNLTWCLSSKFYFNNTSHLLQGTEYYDGKAKRYVDFPITDILQMMGRAGRPQFDQHGKAVILVHEPKKSFYKKVKIDIADYIHLLMISLMC